MFTLIFIIIMIALVATFSVQNAIPVSVAFLSWRFESSLAIVIILALIAGMIAGMALLSWLRISRSARAKRATIKDRQENGEGK